MLIVSQDKKRVVQNLNLEIKLKGEYDKNYVIYNTELGVELGEYETEGRAKEILREIIDTYKFNKTEAIGQVEAVYEMPKAWGI